MALFRTLPAPTNDLFPRLMVEVCLVLAPDVNFFLNSRKQGLPCWRSLFFSISFRIRQFIREHDLTNRLHICMWLLKTYAIPAGMYASQVWATPFLRYGKEMGQSFTKMANDSAQEDSDGQGHNSFLVCHARAWSRASTVQLVLGGSVAIQYFNPKQWLHCKKDLTCWYATELAMRWLLVIPHPVCFGWSHNPTCSRKGCWSVNPLILVVLLWTSGRGTWIIGHLILI